VEAIVATADTKPLDGLIEQEPSVVDELNGIVARDLVRQLLLATSVRYHGEGDGKMVVWTADPKGLNVIRENGKPLKKVWLETPGSHSVNGTDSVFIDGKAHLFLGQQGGYFSGDDQCIMRLTFADAYTSKTDPSVRYLLRGHGASEKPGESLCISKKGTGVNDPGALFPLYGDATYGACKLQLNVSDVGK
jgi:hypothetical protein